MINEETIVSVYNDKMTLLQFLKTVNKALDEAVLTSVEVSKKGNATLSFVFEFADGTKIESGEIVLQQGESVTDAKIVNGHLYLTLSNDERLDAGNVKPVTRFEINANQHLIVYYGDGTTQDLGAIFQGDVSINGKLTANVVDGVKITGNEIVEKMNGYSVENISEHWTPTYISAVKNGNKLTIVFCGNVIPPTKGAISLCSFKIPQDVGVKLFPYKLGEEYFLDNKAIQLFNTNISAVQILADCQKTSNTTIRFALRFNDNVIINQQYYFRYEITFLLSDNMAV